MESSNELKKVLIIGANGFLGTNIINISSNNTNGKFKISTIAADIDKSLIPLDVPFYYIDITNSSIVLNQINKIRPDYIVLTAALTNVDKCEVEKELATKINYYGAKNVLKACQKIGAKIVFLSTDFVFDGISKSGNYNEKDKPNPLSHYGMTKYKAEIEIVNSNVDYLICRTAVLYGWNRLKLNFITWILKSLKNREQIKIVRSQVNNPTYVPNLAEIILTLIDKDASGIYHTSGKDSMNRYAVALKCAEIFEFDTNLIKPLEEYKQIARRPENVGLDISKLKEVINNELNILGLEEGLLAMKGKKEEFGF